MTIATWGDLLVKKEYKMTKPILQNRDYTLSVAGTMGRNSVVAMLGNYMVIGRLKNNTITFRITDFTEEDTIVLICPEGGSITHAQLERGNKASDWTPAPEDAQARIDNAVNSLKNEAIPALKDGLLNSSEKEAVKQSLNVVSADKKGIDMQYTTVYANTALTGTAKSNLNSAKVALNTAFTNLQSAINDVLGVRDGTRITTTQMTLVTTRLNEYGTALSTYNQRYEQAQDAISMKYVDDVEVGGRNLIVQSTITRGKFLTVTGNESINAGWFYTDFIPVSNYKNLVTSGYSILGDSPSVVYYNSSKVFVKGINNGNLERAKNITIDSGIAFIRFSGMLVDLPTLKLEKGNKATDWTPAPEDVDSAISTVQSELTVEADKIIALTTKTNGHETQIGTLVSSYDGLSSTVTALETGKVGTVAFSALEQNLSGFKLTVQDTYANKTTVTELATQWTTTTELVNGHTSQITSMGEAINLRLTKEQVADEILNDKTAIKGRETTNDSPQYYYDNYQLQKVREYKNITALGLTGNYSGLLETESQGVSSPWPTFKQTFYTSTYTYSRSAINGSTWGSWAKVVDSSNVLTQINLSEEGVLIQGKNIWLDGNTKINNSIIKTAHIADLAVSSAKIVSLDASKITVGTLNGHTLNGGTITGGTITGTSFFNSGADGDMSIANGRIRAKDFFVEAEGSLTSLTSYVVVRSNQSHVFLQPAENYGVSVTKVRTAGGTGNFMPITASAFRGGNSNAVFEALNGYTVVRSSGDTQPVYLQGSEIRATSVSSAGNYVAVRASAFPTGSMESFKTDIKQYSDSALELIRGATIYDYKLKSDLASGRVKTRIGLVIGQGYNTPSEIIDGDGIEQYAMNSLGWKAIQELDIAQKETEIAIWQLKNEIEALKGAINE